MPSKQSQLAGSYSYESSVEGASKSSPKPAPNPFFIPLNVGFYAFLLANTLAASLAPIQDCDEVFNYWEPTHYLVHGYGLQTWEYSPEYSIRSWLYVSLHAGIAKISTLVTQSKTAQFYFVRMALAFICAACETRIFAAISRTLHPRIGVIFVTIMVFSPGMFHASTAMLPSSFTMYTSMLGISAFMDWRGGLNTGRGIMWFGIGAIVGWPFAGALVVSFLLEEVLIGYGSEFLHRTLIRFTEGVIKCLVVLVLEVVTDSLFYRKLVVVPWNIVSYNVFGGSNKGPNIFGTEPWTFYFRNLLLNFNIWFLLALSAAPLLILQTVFRPRDTSKQTILRTVALLLPFYIWLGIFTIQPHKEERFMYAAYPFLALNAAIAFHNILAYLGSSNRKEFIGRVPRKVKLAIALMPVLLATNISLLRTLGIVTAYSAPLQLFQPLENPEVAAHGDHVCFGKEWYRFPSSFFLPAKKRAKFIKSEFNGLLPGEFTTEADGRGPRPGTWMVPSGMNDQNQEDPGKYQMNISQCNFLVDSYFPGDEGSALQPNYVLDKSTWEEISCRRFLDTKRTRLPGRIIWIPDLPFIPEKLQRKWGRYCLLRRRNPDTSP
ncbi:asparagine-linked glycosylation 9 protein isoform a [Histoplasma capsulatum G186AR]|uniref:Mannosyltransferase n=1 Tax=Ajellomyces capsulatus (strain G186AR / H82 / ATCC MYA-2454 / RMSCC 2432) TaxID=447093 RepID=C0NL52_AJECG|nr:asparagine-linked glycosylation 9 protein isoform a [Histoplasma capsulatum G186AR]EEH08593.1 asparagine-linked glycosylation 9 protein isoform a [Histoplasma capsulatum G186AR]